MVDSYLLDTHVLLWFLSGDGRMSNTSLRLVSSPDNRCFVSIASLWEIAVKIKIGKLNLSIEFRDLVNTLNDNNIETLPITFDHILETMNLEDHHRDPFDRIILAQAKHEVLTIISKDENFEKYSNIKLIW